MRPLPLRRRAARAAALVTASAVVLSGCGFSPYDVPLPGGANLGDDPYTVTVQFRDVLDLVPQSAVRVDDIAVGKVTSIELDGWTATATLKINSDATLPDDAEATIRQSSLLGEKFVNLAAPQDGGTGTLSEGDEIPLQRSGRNPDIEEVLGAASLLLNGGGIEKTNTIVKELSKALDGNEPEVKELLQTTTSFVGQLDDNKEALLTSLEKINALALATTEQEDAITGALDDLPEALAVLEDQRGELVELLAALDRLGDVATGVIRRSKDDTLAVLRDLGPTLKGLADSGDDLAKAFEVLLSFPFTDAIVGNSVSRAMVSCSDKKSTFENVRNGACYGDYSNLDINLTLNAPQVVNLIQGLLSLPAALLEGATGGDEAAEDEPAPGADQASRLVELVEGLVPAGQEPEPSAPASSEPSDRSGGGGLPSPGFCNLLGSCRTEVSDVAQAQSTDLGRLLIGSAVAR